MEAFLRSLPKVELHAHINGCIRDSTLRELSNESVEVLDGETRTLPQCFKIFSLIHKATTNLSSIRRITREAIEDFSEDNVRYLELRTTPKHRPENGTTKATYMKAVLEGRNDFYRHHPNSTIQIRFILSIDRRENTEAAVETVELASRLMESGVVGIDLSGDPKLGTFTDWAPAFYKARSVGLKMTFHTGELKDDEEETLRLLRFRPERVGHMCFASEAVRREFESYRIPLEICLSSNLKTQSVASLQSHHIVVYAENQHPFAICTDDPGPFATTLTKEYLLAVEALRMDERQLFELAFKTIDYCFCSEMTKNQLRVTFRAFEKERRMNS